MARAFPQSIKEKVKYYHGGAAFSHSSPDLYSKGIQSVNLEIPFEDALMLSMALQSCLHSINRYDRRTKKGKSTGVLLSIKTANSSIRVLETILMETR